jgi:hypothetical protein
MIVGLLARFGKDIFQNQVEIKWKSKIRYILKVLLTLGAKIPLQ